MDVLLGIYNVLILWCSPRVSWHIWVSSVSSNWLMNLQVGCLGVVGTGDYVHYTTTNWPHTMSLPSSHEAKWHSHPSGWKGQKTLPRANQMSAPCGPNSKVKSWKLTFQSLLSVKSIWCDFLTLSSSKICNVVCDVKVFVKVLFFFNFSFASYSHTPCVHVFLIYTSWLCLARIHTNKHWQKIAARKHRPTSKYWQIWGVTLGESTN